LPHIHVHHGADRAVVDITTGVVLAGDVKRQQARLVRDWMNLHRAELLEAWERASEGEPPGTIEPLP
jgi:hypothetical protein